MKIITHDLGTLRNNLNVTVFFLTFLCGIYVSAQGDFAPLGAGIFFAIAFAVGIISFVKDSHYVLPAFALAFFALGAFRFATQYELPQTNIVNYIGQEAKIEGIVEDRLISEENGEGKLRYTVSAKKILLPKGFEPQERFAEGKLYIYGKLEGEPARIGDEITARGKIRGIHGFSNPGQINRPMLLRAEGIVATISAYKSGVKTAKKERENFRRLMEDIRTHYRESMEKVMPKEDASAIFAMLFGGYQGIKPELTEAFTLTGIVHILSVSGSHISLLIAFVSALGGLLNLPVKLRFLLIIFFVTSYSALAGFTPPVLRAAVMGTACFLAIALEREYDAKRIFMLTGLGLLLYNPLLLFHISFQLSFSATAGLIYISPLLMRQLKKFPSFINLSLSITIGAQLMTLPFLAWYFNQISISSLLANLTAAPLVEIIIMAGLVAGIISLFLPFMGSIVFLLDSLLLGLVYETTRFLANIPYSAIYLPTMGKFLSLLYFTIIALIINDPWREKLLLMVPKKLNKPHTLLNVIILFLLITTAWQRLHPKEMAVHFIDVGQGNAALIITPHERAFMIDVGGVRDNAFDIGDRVDVPYLKHYGINKLDAIFLTHAHEDHAGSVAAIAKKIPTERVFTAHEGISVYAKSFNVGYGDPLMRKVVPVKKGSRFLVDGVEIEVLYAPTKVADDTGNEYSNVYKVTYGNARFLFTGDIVISGEKDLIKTGQDLTCTVLQVGHHGSSTSSSPEFVAATHPTFAVISVGVENSFGHPKKDVVERFQKSGAKILRTDKLGAITFFTDGKTMRYDTFKQ